MNNDPQLSILIPAAGASHRLGQSKQLVRLKSGTLIQNAVNLAESIAPREIIVVTGANAKAVKDAVHQATVRWIHNPHWSKGMGSSIAAGMSVIAAESSAVMILLCDQWRLQTSDLQALTNAWCVNPGRICCAQSEGKNMPPVIFPACYFEELRELDGKNGARSILEKHAGVLTPVTLHNAAFDLDTQAHFSIMKATTCNR